MHLRRGLDEPRRTISMNQLKTKWCPGVVSWRVKGHLVSVDFFHKDASRRDGLASYCKTHSRRRWRRSWSRKREVSMTEHGTRMGYGQGCRCADCRRANSEYEHARRNPAPAEETVLAKSERAIEREIQLRRIEQEMAARLTKPEVERDEPAFEPVSIARFLRQPKVAARPWGCPQKGCAST